jgi:hypothetical protein
MMTERDMTKEQALRWMAQELKKATTHEKIDARIKSETEALRLGEQYGLDKGFPVSTAAHKQLIVYLQTMKATFVA